MKYFLTILVYLKLKSDVIRKKKLEYVETSQHEFENQTLNKSGKCFGSQTVFFFFSFIKDL
jgi:hypothetical protein